MNQLMACWVDGKINGWQAVYMDKSTDGLLGVWLIS